MKTRIIVFAKSIMEGYRTCESIVELDSTNSRCDWYFMYSAARQAARECTSPGYIGEVQVDYIPEPEVYSERTKFEKAKDIKEHMDMLHNELAHCERKFKELTA